MAVIMCDLDHFKKINDTYGHAAGDQALMEVAKLLEEHRREGDHCCRYGGEEFAIVLERGEGEVALRVAERLRRAVERCLLLVDGQEIPLRLSLGVASAPELMVRSGKELIELADEALYRAKEAGRNLAVLNLGGGRYRTAAGEEITGEPPPDSGRAPTVFA